MLTSTQIAAGEKVMARLAAVEAQYSGPKITLLHQSMAELRDAFMGEMTEPQYNAFGGGVPK